MSDSPLARAARLLDEAITALAAAAGPGASDEQLLSALTICEGAARRTDQIAVSTIADLNRRGTFTDRGYKNPGHALEDLLGWERFESRRRIVAADQICPRIGLDGTVLPAKLSATAAMFHAGRIGLRHVAVIARVLGSAAASRLAPDIWAGAEAHLADTATHATPTELNVYATALIEGLDHDGAEPDDAPPPPVNELHLRPNRDRSDGTPSGGTITGRIDDAAMYATIASLIDAHAAPLTADDHRSAGQRNAEALADICGYVLDHGPTEMAPDRGGHRPHLSVLVRLEDLEARARSAILDFGGGLSPQALRLLACDAAVIPIVLSGAGQPLDVGRTTRTIPDGLRRAVHARAGGTCEHPGCGRPSSWTECHHIVHWEDGGETALHNLTLVCRAHHRLLHADSGWTVRITGGPPEFIPPAWIDPQRRPRRKPLPHLMTGTDP